MEAEAVPHENVVMRLVANEARERMLLDQAAIGFVWTDNQGRLMWVNQKFCDMTGYSREELLRFDLQAITCVDDWPTACAEFRNLTTGEITTYRLQKRIVCQDGSLLRVEMTVSGGSYRDEKPQQVMCIVIDLSSDLERQAVMPAQHSNCVDDTTGRVENFLVLASHELKTPLTTIKANTQLAMRRLKSLLRPKNLSVDIVLAKVSSVLNMLERAERQIGALNRLVNDLIDISRMQTDDFQLYLRHDFCNLATLVADVVQEQQRATPDRTINIYLPESRHVLVSVDPDRIVQVLSNYIMNALYYADAEKPIDIRLDVIQSEQDTSTYACVSVTDQGPGLSSIEQQRIWDCFYQSPDISAADDSGVGLGLRLHICRTLIEHHSGQTGVKSRPGDGATFWFTLPIIPES
ncbi:MAG TPA: ATP-binding protein [Dictyobacter sp.]|nr:ATP-binding protein [Dictyobacter sp.]